MTAPKSGPHVHTGPHHAAPHPERREPADAASRSAIDRLTMALHLQRRSRTAEPDELPFVMVNETRQLLPYRQAVLFAPGPAGLAVKAISGLAVPDASSPYAQWMGKFARWRAAVLPGRLDRLDLSLLQAAEKSPPWLADWREWLPPHCLWAPLSGGRGGAVAYLALFRETPFSDSDAALFLHLAEAYGQSFRLAGKPAGNRRRTGVIAAALLAAAAAAFIVPVQQTVLAPAEVIARRPAQVRSGLEGVVDRILVEPNARVEAGTPLIRLDDTQLRTRLAVAKKAEEMAESEYRQLLQAALADPRTRQRIPLVVGRKEQLAAETAYLEDMMERIVIYSPMDGVALCDNADDWLGRPVGLGQRIMSVADPDDLHLEINLPAAESIALAVGDPVLFYPNIAPDAPTPGRLTFIAYRAGEAPGLGMVYMLRADLLENNKPLLGLRGTAKLYGDRQPLGILLLGKPIATVRQWLGW